jgi:hypothetical protein
MPSFEGDFYGKRCVSGARSGDVFNDYLDILNGVAFAETTVKWRLHNFASVSEYELWENHMLQGFHRCDTYECMNGSTRLALTVRRVDGEVANLWNKEMGVKGITSATWYDFQKFIHACLCLVIRLVCM